MVTHVEIRGIGFQIYMFFSVDLRRPSVGIRRVGASEWHL